MEPLTPEELRVVACLVEKQFTTPDSYPLTENAVVAACNQLSNRSPVVAYDTNTVRVTLTALRQRGLARVIHTPGARVPKHRHIVDEALGLSRGQVSLLAVLALRGPQTVGELRTRTERMHDFAGLSEVETALEELAGREEPLVVRLERQPGQKEARYAQLLSGPVDAAYTTPAAPGSGAAPAAGAPATLADSHADWVEEDRPARAAAPAAGRSTAPVTPVGPDRLSALEARLAAVEADLAILQAEHRELREEFGLGAARSAGSGSADIDREE
ncbi:MAG: YceH family protein [Acidimicrobiia bacterium]